MKCLLCIPITVTRRETSSNTANLPPLFMTKSNQPELMVCDSSRCRCGKCNREGQWLPQRHLKTDNWTKQPRVELSPATMHGENPQESSSSFECCIARVYLEEGHPPKCESREQATNTGKRTDEPS